MKRLFALFLALAMVFVFVACNGSDTTDTTGSTGDTTPSTENVDNQSKDPADVTDPTEPAETVASGSEVVPDLPATNGSVNEDYTYPASDGSLQDDGE